MMRRATPRLAGLAALAAVVALGFGCTRTEDGRDADLLGQVPADTPYLYISTAPFPGDLQQRLADHGAAEFGALRGELTEVIAELREAVAPPGLVDAARQMADLLEAVLIEVGQRDDAAGLREIGIEPLPRGVLYGQGMLPVFRIALADDERFTALLDRIERRAGLKAARAESQGLAYRRLDLGALYGVVAVDDGHVIGGLAPRDALEAYLPALLGQRRPDRSLAETDTVTGLRERYGFAGISEGFVHLERLARLWGGDGDTLELAGVDALYGPNTIATGCADLVADLVAHAPRITFGVTEAGPDRLTWRTTWETDRPVSDALQRIAAPVNGLGQDTDALLGVGFGVRLPAVRDALTALLREILADSGRCPQIDRGTLENAIPTLNLALGPLTAGLKGLHVRVGDLAIDDTNPQRVELSAAMLAAVDDPRGVLALLAMFDPQLSRLDLPADGSPVPLANPFADALGGSAGAPRLQLALHDQGLLLLAGPDAGNVAAPLRDTGLADPLPLFALDYRLADLVERAAPAVETVLIERAASDPDLADSLRRQLDAYRRQAALVERVSVRAFATGDGLVIRQAMGLR